MEDFDDIIIDNDNQEFVTVDNTVPNYITDDNIEDLLKTEIHICPKCMYPDIIGSVPFNRREVKAVQLRLDNVVHTTFKHFANMNNLNQNAALALLLRIAQAPEVSKMLAGTFMNVSKRKGRNTRSKSIIS